MSAVAPVEPRPAATVLLVRDRGALEVLMVVRHEKAHFASALVFPGGMVDPDDGDPAWSDLALAHGDLPEAERAIRIAGYRELYEETGVLLADRSAPPPAGTAEPDAAPAGERFMDTLRRIGARIDLSAMHPFAHWITPITAPRRFDTHFRICGLGTETVAVSDGHETVSAEWVRPADALEMGAAGTRNLLFPTRMNLTLLARASSVEEAIDQAVRRPLVTVLPRVEKRPEGVFIVLPPDAGYGVVEEPAGSMRP